MTSERFDLERKRAVSATFILRAVSGDAAVKEFEEHLRSPCEGTVSCAWKPQLVEEMLDIPEQGVVRFQQLDQVDSSYYSIVSKHLDDNAIRLVEFREFEPAD